MRGTPGRGRSIGKGSEAGRGRRIPGLKEECEGVLRVGSPGKTVCCPEGAREAGRRLNPPGLHPVFSRFPGPAPSPISGPGTGDGGVSSSATPGWGGPCSVTVESSRLKAFDPEMSPAGTRPKLIIKEGGTDFAGHSSSLVKRKFRTP